MNSKICAKDAHQTYFNFVAFLDIVISNQLDQSGIPVFISLRPTRDFPFKISKQRCKRPSDSTLCTIWWLDFLNFESTMVKLLVTIFSPLTLFSAYKQIFWLVSMLSILTVKGICNIGSVLEISLILEQLPYNPVLFYRNIWLTQMFGVLTK